MPNKDSLLRAPRFFWLDWLRFGAALVVVVGHVRGGHFVAYGNLDQQYHSALVATLFGLSRLGEEAVILFFVLSGFLVGGASVQKAIDGTFGIRGYIIDRFTRIFTPLIPALVFTMGLVLYRGGNVSLGIFFGNLVGLQGVLVGNFGGNAPLWSLAYEIWFYVIWGGVLTLFISPVLYARILAWFAVLIGLIIFAKLEPIFLFCWLLGVLAYFAPSRTPCRLRLAGSLSLIGVGLVLSQLTSESNSLATKDLQTLLPSRAVSTLLLGLGFSVLTRTVVTLEPKTTRWKNLEHWGGPLAGFSYTLYLIHFIVIGHWGWFSQDRARELNLSSLLMFGAKLLVCLGFSWVMYFLFERAHSRINLKKDLI